MANVNRPVQGANSLKPYNRPAPAYKPEISTHVSNLGTQSNPVPNRWPSSLGRSNADATPVPTDPNR